MSLSCSVLHKKSGISSSQIKLLNVSCGFLEKRGKIMRGEVSGISKMF